MKGAVPKGAAPFDNMDKSLAEFAPARRSKLHILRFRASVKAQSFRCSSSFSQTHFVGLCEKSFQCFLQ